MSDPTERESTMQKIEHDKQTIRLVGFGTFEDLHHTIRPAVFGWMVKEASEVLVEFHSDLYHDAKTVADIQGEWRGKWFVRTSGTWLGHVAEAAYERETEGRYYDLHVYDVNGTWYLDVTRTDFEPGLYERYAWSVTDDY